MALEFFQRGGQVDCCIVDFLMPGKTGDEFVREVRKIDPKVGIIMITAYSSAEVQKVVEEMDVMTVMGKPLNFEKLLKMIEDCIYLRENWAEVQQKIMRLESQTVSLSGSDAADILNTKGEMNMSVQDSFQVAIFEKLKNMGKIKAGSAV
jgi:DNA-binding NtrC family response regulator